MQNVRYNISPCSPEEAAAFIAKIDVNKYVPRSAVPASERSHYDRYSYLLGDSKVAVVYDTTAHVISITAPPSSADELLSIFSPDSTKTIKNSTVPAQGRQQIPTEMPDAPQPTKITRSKVFVPPKLIDRNIGGQTVIVTGRGAELWTDEIFPPQRAKPRVAPEIASGANDVGRATRGGEGLNISLTGAGVRADGVRRATISFGDEETNQKPDKPTPARSGTGLFADIATGIEAPVAPERRVGRPPKADNTPEQDGDAKTKASQIQAKLKKRLPTAFEFLSEQARVYFSNGIHDFEQASLTLLDYSVLLVPPYKGLERFVFDLQRAEGINVKMIGQAFDKDEAGRYILKRGYQHRIGSVIYSEVMVALYSEYFSRRNFITHSDNTGGSEPRSISDRQEAKRIFDNLLNIVEYNAKKLKEIGFKMERDA